MKKILRTKSICCYLVSDMVASETCIKLFVGIFLIIWLLNVFVFILGHTIKPGKPEHGATELGTPRNSITPRNSRIRNTGETAENLNSRTMECPRTPAEHPKYQRNPNVTPAKHPGTTEP